MVRVRAAIERAAALHRQAAATADAAGAALDLFLPGVAPPALVARQRQLAAAAAALAEAVAPGWLSATIDGAGDAVTRLPTGTGAADRTVVRIGVAHPLPDTLFPIVVPLLGTGHLALEADLRSAGVLRSVLVRLVAATFPGALRIRAVDPSGVEFAAFEPLFGGRVMPRPVTDPAGLRAVLSEAEQWVRMPGAPGRSLLLVVAGRPAGTDDADLARIVALAEDGPDAGVHLLLGDWPADAPALPRTAHVRFRGAVTIVDGAMVDGPVTLDRDPPAAVVSDLCGRVGARAGGVTTLRLTDLLPTGTWQDDAADGLVTSVGLTGNVALSLRLTDRTPHWLVGGRAGAGTSALILDVLYGLCSRYRPADLAVHLIGLEPGNDFDALLPGDADPSWMPHVRVAATGPDPGPALAVLRDLEAEAELRAARCAEVGVGGIGALPVPDRFPRVVCVVDGFAALLDEERGLASLSAIARSGRTAGIHLILAGRVTREGVEALQGRRDASVGLFPVRIALPGGGGVLDVRNRAADDLRLGTAVVNTAGGLGGPAGASRAHERIVEFPDPQAEPRTLATLRRRLWLARGDQAPPRIHRGDAPAPVAPAQATAAAPFGAAR